jgi:hypothetical protein
MAGAIAAMAEADRTRMVYNLVIGLFMHRYEFGRAI